MINKRLLFIFPLLVLLCFSTAVRRYPGGTLDDLPTPTPTMTPLGENDVIPLSLQGTLHLFAFLGQSNMVGVDAIPPDQPLSPTVFRFNNVYHWTIGKEPTDAPVAGGSYNIVDDVSADTFAGYSMAMPFALRLQELRGGNYAIGLIPCAKGSTKIVSWQRAMSEQTLYGSCLRRIRAASNMGILSGVLFYQGEQDANGSARYRSEYWNEDFLRMVDSLRGDLGNPDLPIGFVQINSLPNPPYNYTEIVQQQQASVNYYNVVMVSAIGLPQLSDGIHLTWQGQTTLGRNMADAIDPILSP